MPRTKHYSRLIFIMLFLVTCSCSVIHRQDSDSVTRIARGNFTEVAWSPDESSLIAISHPPAPGVESNIYNISYPSGDVELIPGIRLFSHPSWSPDGSQVSITVELDTIQVLDPWSGTLSYLTYGEAATWSADGSRLYVYEGILTDPTTSERRIHIVNREGTIEESIMLGPIENDLNEPEYITGFSLSPDETQALLGLSILQSGLNRYETYLVNLDDGTLEYFRVDEGTGCASWSPDGNRIAYIHFEQSDYVGELRIADLQNNTLLSSSIEPEVQSISWSPGGDMIAFVLDGDVYVQNIDKIQ